MTVHQTRRLVRKLLLLIVLAVALVVMSTSPVGRRAAAVPCDQCDANYEACIASCGDPCSSAALFFCQNRYNRCLATCTP